MHLITNSYSIVRARYSLLLNPSLLFHLPAYILLYNEVKMMAMLLLLMMMGRGGGEKEEDENHTHEKTRKNHADHYRTHMPSASAT
jgi:hypothetical protein